MTRKNCFPQLLQSISYSRKSAVNFQLRRSRIRYQSGKWKIRDEDRKQGETTGGFISSYREGLATA